MQLQARVRVRWDESGARTRNVMPTITKSRTKLKSTRAAVDATRVSTSKRRAAHRSKPREMQTEPVQGRIVNEKTVTLPPSGSKPDDTPTRSRTQNTQGVEGGVTMRIVALDLGIKKTSYCELSAGQVVERATVSELSTLRPLLGPDQPPATVAIEACRQAWFVHDCLVAWGNEVVLVDTTRSRQLG